MKVGQVTDVAVQASVPYKTLQTQFSVLYSDHMQVGGMECSSFCGCV